MKTKLLFAAVAALLFASCERTPVPDSDSVNENPDPTTISGVILAKAGISVDKDGFNMLADGNFERFSDDDEWKTKSLWYLNEYTSEAETPYEGNRTIHMDCGREGWSDVVQSICLKKNQSYDLTLSYRGAWDGLNCYMGFRGASGHDQSLNYEGKGSAWEEYRYSYANTDDVKVDAFFGGWGWNGLWLEFDKFKVIPTGSNNDSFVPQDASVISTEITNASFTEIESAGKIIAWFDGDKISSVFHNVSADGKTLGNIFVSSSDKNAFDGIRINMADAVEIAESGYIPTSGITVSGIRYIHYYTNVGMTTPTEEDDPETFVPDWVAGKSGVLCSEDGKSWKETNLSWSETGNFVRIAYLQKDNYVYMFGTPAGDAARMTYVARVEASGFADQAAYQYWDGAEWVANDETAAKPIMYGPASEASVVYNPSRYTYMMIYRSSTTGGLVYRDAGMPEGEWSGEKILMLDDDNTYYAPQILGVSKDELVFIANKQ